MMLDQKDTGEQARRSVPIFCGGVAEGSQIFRMACVSSGWVVDGVIGAHCAVCVWWVCCVVGVYARVVGVGVVCGWVW
jgi:hypothetical protein